MLATLFYADAVLFDMDSTLTDSKQPIDSIQNVEAATPTGRASSRQFKHAVEDEVAAFESSILFYTDTYHKFGPGSASIPSSGALTPALSSDSGSPSPTSSGPPSRQPSVKDATDPIRPSFAWEIEAATVDRSVKILPGVRRMLASIPPGRYAVVTSDAKTYGQLENHIIFIQLLTSRCTAYGCMERVGINPPQVTVTADDKRLEAGKPAPDPFLLAAQCLGFSAANCVVFEDSPSGIRSIASAVIAVCTSHERAQIEHSGAYYIVEDMRQVQCTVEGQRVDIRLRFTILAA
ncbi:HAD-like protein [Mycena vulgaris]|nr:HAD-like protein [Mycena vulgaris]